ncbi:MAG: deoxyguanosinetriphosphate triphosphohydrolase [Leptospiraceae bacterium]|nr:deoxyguanosinetriphosphate triphosphohydrolase [Leptospiraceae bacterium]
MNLIEKRLDETMAPWAMLHKDSGGRLYHQQPHEHRTCFQRDRDRIIHSKAFRRLGYKTQVFMNSAGDNYRTRLTHSLEVAQVARSAAQALNLNADYAEALALAHDLGHTPFGHAGQEALNHLMRDHGGFEHNRQSLRIVSSLETRYLEFHGLNLTRSTLKGMMKHAQVYECDPDLRPICQQRSQEQPGLEAALVDQCDRIAYVHHDLEDGLDARILNLDDLRGLDFWRTAWQDVLEQNPHTFQKVRSQVQIRSVIRYLMDHCIRDLQDTSSQNLRNLAIQNQADLKALKKSDYPVGYTSLMGERIRVMQDFLYQRLYRFPAVMQMSRRGARIIETLFGEYASLPALMPSHFQIRIAAFGLERVIADYISGMTDRFALHEYSRLTGHRML